MLLWKILSLGARVFFDRIDDLDQSPQNIILCYIISSKASFDILRQGLFLLEGLHFHVFTLNEKYQS